MLIGLVPLLLGLLFEIVVVAPLRVPLDQTPVVYPWQVWHVSFYSWQLYVILGCIIYCPEMMNELMCGRSSRCYLDGQVNGNECIENISLTVN